MKKGILGLGNASTLFYVNEINTEFQRRNGGYSTCPFILYQVNFDEVNPYLPHDFHILIPAVQNYFLEMKNIGIKTVLIPNITLHETVDQISTDIHIINAIDLTLKKLQKGKISRVVLFGTVFTMDSEYMKRKFAEKEIQLLSISLEDQLFVDNFRKKVYEGKETVADVLEFQKLSYLYSQQETLVLACTELSIHSIKNDSIFDMVQIQIDEFLK